MMMNLTIREISLSILLLLLAGAAAHFWRLGVPREIVFDEVHFGKFVTAYCCTHERFFDIHPPHGKLLIAGTARLLGYEGGHAFEHIGQPYGEISPIPLRLFPAVMGIILPLVIFYLLMEFGVSRPVAFLGGMALALDNALLVQTRIIALDGILLAATFGSLLAFLKKQYVLAGALAGLAAGTKFTGLAALGLLGGITFVHLIQSRDAKLWFKRGTLVLASAFLVYLIGWWLHFALLTQPGPGDIWGVPTGHFISDTISLHKTMLGANYNLEATHPDESPWWSWPWMKNSIFYWSGSAGQVIYFLGNPLVWWGSALLFLIAVFDRVRKRMTNDQFTMTNLWIPLVGFLVAMLPFVRIPRALFLYHYLTPLLFTLLFGFTWLDTQIPHRVRNWVVGAGVVSLAAVFFLFSPLTYGLTVSPEWLASLFWLPEWR